MAHAGEVTLRCGRPRKGATVGPCGAIWFGDVRRQERTRVLKDLRLLKVAADYCVGQSLVRGNQAQFGNQTQKRSRLAPEPETLPKMGMMEMPMAE